MAGITDVFTTVTVPKLEYEELVRDSEKLGVIEALLQKNNYITTGDLQAILGIEKREEKKNAEIV